MANRKIMKKNAAETKSASKQIDAKIQELGGWKGATLSRIRTLIKEADSEIIEEIKWKKPSNPFGVPCWSHDGLICTGETYKNVVKMTFAKGASLNDANHLFNSKLEGKVTRAVDFFEGDRINEKALKNLVRAAVELNKSASFKK